MIKLLVFGESLQDKLVFGLWFLVFGLWFLVFALWFLKQTWQAKTLSRNFFSSQLCAFASPCQKFTYQLFLSGISTRTIIIS